MAEWFMDGMLKRLLDPHDPVSRKLLQHTVFYVVRPSPTLCLVMRTVVLHATFRPSNSFSSSLVDLTRTCDI